MSEKITHDHKCGKCGDPAEVNYQPVWVSWDINPDGDFKNQDFCNVDTDEWWCSRCWELDRNEKYNKLEEVRKKWHKKLKN